MTKAKAAPSAVFHSRGDWLALLWIILMACAGNPHGRSKDEWAQARTVAEHYLRDKYGSTWTITAERHAFPFMFHVDGVEESTVLIHDNAVFTQRGMAGLDRYLRGSRCVEQQLPTVRDMPVLLRVFDAFPPDPNPQGYLKSDSPHEEWRPHLDYLDGGRARLRLIYMIDDSNKTEDGGEGEDTEGELREWTLKMDQGQMPVWTSQIRSWDRVKEQWVVDHTN
jgi:hypothetical protein